MDSYEPLSTLFIDQIKDVKLNANYCVIPAGAQCIYPIVITIPGTLLRWSFLSVYYDISFKVTKDLGNGEFEVIKPLETFSGDKQQEGSLMINDIGTYNLIFDNLKSWIRERNVLFSASMTVSGITTDLKNACSAKILKDLQDYKYKGIELNQVIDEKNHELEALKILGNQRQAQKELLDTEVEELQKQVAELTKEVADYKLKAKEEQSQLKQFAGMTPFLLELDRVFSMLDSEDMLHLACVNRYLNEVTHHDAVWEHLFTTDSKEHINIAIKNDWLMQKWRLHFSNTTSVSV